MACEASHAVEGDLDQASTMLDITGKISYGPSPWLTSLGTAKCMLLLPVRLKHGRSCITASVVSLHNYCICIMLSGGSF